MKDVRNGEKRGLRFNLDAADRAIRFIETRLKLAGGQFEGKPFLLDLSQKFIVGSVFGWQSYAPKLKQWVRRFRRAYIEMAKGNGKSPLAAAISLYLMMADGEARAEIYAAGANKDQAYVLFNDAVAMVDYSPDLRRRITKAGRNPVWQLTCTAGRARGSKFRPISQDKKKSGPRPSCGVCDELHEHPNAIILDMLERGFKWRRQPLLLMITNSGSNLNTVCGREHTLSVKVAAGDIMMDHHFAYVCAMDGEERDADGKITRPADDPITDPSVWPKANPLLGVTTTEKELHLEADMARAVPGLMNEILRLRFCVWTDADRAWLPRATVERVLRPFDPMKEHAGKKVGLGLDLSAVQDLTSLALAVQTGTVKLQREEKDGGGTVELPTFDAWIEAWTPRDTLQARALRDKAPYPEWVREGWLHAPQGETIRLDFVAARVANLLSIFRAHLLAFDRYAYREFESELDKLGVVVKTLEHPQGGTRRGKAPADEVETAKLQGIAPTDKSFPQGLWMPGSVRELTNLIYQQRIRLQRSPVLVSAIASAAFDSDAFGNQWFSKIRATGRIDPLVALAMAVGAVSRPAFFVPDLDGFLRQPVTSR